SAWTIDIHHDVLFWIRGSEEKQLCGEQVCHLVINGEPKKNNSIGNQPREHVDSPEISWPLFDHVLCHVFNLLCVAINCISAHPKVVNRVFSEFILVRHSCIFLKGVTSGSRKRHSFYCRKSGQVYAGIRQ